MSRGPQNCRQFFEFRFNLFSAMFVFILSSFFLAILVHWHDVSLADLSSMNIVNVESQSEIKRNDEDWTHVVAC